MESERDTEHGDTELVPNRGATSVAWTWFGYEQSDTHQKTVLCKICHRPVPTTGSNTTNFFYHLRKNHVKHYGESLRMRPIKVQSSAQNTPQTQTLQEAFSRDTPCGKESRRWKEITAAVTIYVCKEMAPIYTVEKPLPPLPVDEDAPTNYFNLGPNSAPPVMNISLPPPPGVAMPPPPGFGPPMFHSMDPMGMPPPMGMRPPGHVHYPSQDPQRMGAHASRHGGS